MDNGVAKSGQNVYAPETDREVVKDKGGVLWCVAWRPLLQGMARMCCDRRRPVRQTAITYLQRALLSHELQVLTATEWQACFLDVFFPMLSRLLEDIPSPDRAGLEETRVRGSNLLCKVFLQHLPSLSLLPTFTELWVNILDFMDKFMNLEYSDLLYEAIPESLKNMLLVMSTQGIFDNVTINSSQSDPSIRLTTKESNSQLLWEQTRNKLDKFLPNLLRDLFPNMVLPPPTETTPTHIVTMTTIAMPMPGETPVESPSKSPSSSPLSTSPGMELHTSTDSIESSFPITLHPPLPPAITTEPTSDHSSGQTGSSTSITGQMSSVISISAQAASVPDQSSSTTSVTGQTGSTTSVTGQTSSTTSVTGQAGSTTSVTGQTSSATSVTGQTGSTISLTGQTSVDQQEESSTELGVSVPAPNVAGPILIPHAPPYALSDGMELGHGGMESGHFSTSPNSKQLPVQFSASVYNM